MGATTPRSRPSNAGSGNRHNGRVLAAVLEAITDTPRLVVDAAILRRNIEGMARAAREAGVRVRPHVKTHKSPVIARMQLDEGADGIQVAKLGEAEVMAAAGCDDILVGYPIVGSEKLERLTALARRARVAVATDDLGVARGVAEAARGAGQVIGLYLEVDSGAHRLGVAPERSPAVAAEMANLHGIEFRGIFTHEGHAYRCEPGTDELAALCAGVAATMAGVAEALEAEGVACPEVSVGSTPSVRYMLRHPGITTVRPGTYVFNDRTTLELGAATDAQLAAWVVATVVGRPAPERVVVDAGSKALSSDQRPFAPTPSYGLVLGRPRWEVVGVSEEHGLVRVGTDEEVRIGDRVAILPNHACGTVNLWHELTVVEDGRVVDRWPVEARGKMW
jgi:D-serine deaminase-like pyridoxal phosphate-dependent protein